MLHKWIRIVKCSDVKPGELVRVGEDPHIHHAKEAIVEGVTESRIKLADGLEVHTMT